MYLVTRQLGLFHVRKACPHSILYRGTALPRSPHQWSPWCESPQLALHTRTFHAQSSHTRKEFLRSFGRRKCAGKARKNVLDWFSRSCRPHICVWKYVAGRQHRCGRLVCSKHEEVAQEACQVWPGDGVSSRYGILRQLPLAGQESVSEILIKIKFFCVCVAAGLNRMIFLLRHSHNPSRDPEGGPFMGGISKYRYRF